MKQKIESVWPQWTVIKHLGSGSFGKVFEVVRDKYGVEEHCAVKVISLPNDEEEVKTMRDEGLSMSDISVYYEGVVAEITQEIALMSKLKGNTNIVSYEDFEVVERKDGFGWDIFIRMELLTALPTYIESRRSNEEATISVCGKAPMLFGENDVLRMAIDLCTGLEVCHARNIVHRDIKPGNIFVSENGDYKLGDFGVARTVEKTLSAMSKKGTPAYMAPEVYKGEPGGLNSDFYSLGIMMYRLLNGNRHPFLPDYPLPITYEDSQQAMIRRIKGDPLPFPCNAGDKVFAIIQKACAYDPHFRYQTASDMKRDLIAALKGDIEKAIIDTKGSSASVAVTEKPSSTMLSTDNTVKKKRYSTLRIDEEEYGENAEEAQQNKENAFYEPNEALFDEWCDEKLTKINTDMPLYLRKIYVPFRKYGRTVLFGIIFVLCIGIGLYEGVYDGLPIYVLGLLSLAIELLLILTRKARRHYKFEKYCEMHVMLRQHISWTCPCCRMENDRQTACERCGVLPQLYDPKG